MTVDEVRTAYLAAIRTGDRRRAFGVVDAAREAGMGIPTLYEDVFQPAQREIGRLWQSNTISVADEHLATAITQAAMTRVYDELFRAEPREGHTLIAACVDTERHELGLRMICDLMELKGWDTTYLGANVPIEDLVRMVRERRPRAVALSAALTPHLTRVQAAIAAIRDAMGDDAPLLLVGGRAFADDAAIGAAIGADITAMDAEAAAAALEQHA